MEYIISLINHSATPLDPGLRDRLTQSKAAFNPAVS
jgi:hypothetical protein